MRTLFCAAAALLLAAPAFADDKGKPKPNTLTPKEISDGWILLFDGETNFGWKTEGDATVAVKDGNLLLQAGDKGGWVWFTTRFPENLDLAAEWRGAKARFWYLSTGGGSIWVGDETTPHTLATFRRDGRSLAARAEHRVKPDVDPITSDGGRVKDCDPGPMKVGFELQAGASVAVARLAVRPASIKPLFAGKNLDGWKINAADPKRMLSKWEVTTDGELSLKNGPGDLVTEKEFDNFVLQLECKTLGDGLNSGVFFRCIPGQYQNGYEAQIQNATIDNDRTKPKDAGTGAIYRRVPARKVVANDNAWFTMTVVANGKHIATWVNGYQTVDWLDDRKENENPRQGYRAAKGPISLQGHDKTTDILFRNIRIAELGAEKK